MESARAGLDGPGLCAASRTRESPSGVDRRNDEEEFHRTFRGSALKRVKLNGLLRNAAVAMGNSGERKYLPRLRELAQQEDPAVAEHARWAIAKLETTTGIGTEQCDDRNSCKSSWPLVDKGQL